MTGLSDFQTAMAALFAIVVVFSFALVGRRAGVAAAVPKEGLDAIAAEVAELKLKQAETDHSIAQIRTMVGALPSIKAFHELELKVTGLDGKVDVNNAIVASTSRTVERIETYLLRPER